MTTNKYMYKSNNPISWNKMFHFGWLGQWKARPDFISSCELKPMRGHCIKKDILIILGCIILIVKE